MPQKQKHKSRQSQRKRSLPDQFLRTLKDRYGYFDPKALTAFVSFIILIAIWFGDQFMGKKLNDLMVEVFAFLVFSLLGLKILPWKKQGMTTEHEQEEEIPDELK
jgi:hypothetical protein